MQIYIETSVWSFAFADDSPDYTAETMAFFDRCRQGLLMPIISTVVLEELDRADDPLRTQLRGLVDDISPTVLRLSADARSLADAFLRHGAVPPSKPEDARHVAVAFVAGLEFWYPGTFAISRTFAGPTGSTPSPSWRASTSRCI